MDHLLEELDQDLRRGSWVIDAATRTTHRFREPRPEGYAEQSMNRSREGTTGRGWPW